MTTQHIDQLIGLPDYLYPLLEGRNVADFDYQGSAGVPIRRVIVLIDCTPTHYTGYEICRDNLWTTIDYSLVKSFRRDRISRDERYVHRMAHLPEEYIRAERVELVQEFLHRP